MTPSTPAPSAAAGLAIRDAGHGDEAAWRDLESAGGARPETDVEGELLRSQLQRQQMDKAVDAQLEHLKRKLGKDGT